MSQPVPETGGVEYDVLNNNSRSQRAKDRAVREENPDQRQQLGRRHQQSACLPTLGPGRLTDGCCGKRSDGRIEPENRSLDNSSSATPERLATIEESLESSISLKARVKISSILQEVSQLSDVEKLLLYLKLPTGIPGDEQLRQTPTSLHVSNRVDQTQAFTWVKSHLEEDSDICLPKHEVYEEYRVYCDNLNLHPLSTADFGKIMKCVFPNIKPRRLGQRGQSKYCYSGVRKKLEVQPPSLPELEISPRKFKQEDDLGRDELFAASCQLVCEWAEKLLERSFTGLRDLSEFLVQNLCVNSKSMAAFSVIAAMQEAGVVNSSAAISSLFSNASGGDKHRETQLQLQRKLQEREMLKEQKRKIQQQRHENERDLRSPQKGRNEIQTPTLPSPKTKFLSPSSCHRYRSSGSLEHLLTPTAVANTRGRFKENLQPVVAVEMDKPEQQRDVSKDGIQSALYLYGDKGSSTQNKEVRDHSHPEMGNKDLRFHHVKKPSVISAKNWVDEKSGEPTKDSGMADMDSGESSDGYSLVKKGGAFSLYEKVALMGKPPLVSQTGSTKSAFVPFSQMHIQSQSEAKPHDSPLSENLAMEKEQQPSSQVSDAEELSPLMSSPSTVNSCGFSPPKCAGRGASKSTKDAERSQNFSSEPSMEQTSPSTPKRSRTRFAPIRPKAVQAKTILSLLQEQSGGSFEPPAYDRRPVAAILKEKRAREQAEAMTQTVTVSGTSVLASVANITGSNVPSSPRSEVMTIPVTPVNKTNELFIILGSPAAGGIGNAGNLLLPQTTTLVSATGQDNFLKNTAVLQTLQPGAAVLPNHMSTVTETECQLSSADQVYSTPPVTCHGTAVMTVPVMTTNVMNTCERSLDPSSTLGNPEFPSGDLSGILPQVEAHGKRKRKCSDKNTADGNAKRKNQCVEQSCDVFNQTAKPPRRTRSCSLVWNANDSNGSVAEAACNLEPGQSPDISSLENDALLDTSPQMVNVEFQAGWLPTMKMNSHSQTTSVGVGVKGSYPSQKQFIKDSIQLDERINNFLNSGVGFQGKSISYYASQLTQKYNLAEINAYRRTVSAPLAENALCDQQEFVNQAAASLSLSHDKVNLRTQTSTDLQGNKEDLGILKSPYANNTEEKQVKVQRELENFSMDTMPNRDQSLPGHFDEELPLDVVDFITEAMTSSGGSSVFGSCPNSDLPDLKHEEVEDVLQQAADNPGANESVSASQFISSCGSSGLDDLTVGDNVKPDGEFSVLENTQLPQNAATFAVPDAQMMVRKINESRHGHCYRSSSLPRFASVSPQQQLKGCRHQQAPLPADSASRASNASGNTRRHSATYTPLSDSGYSSASPVHSSTPGPCNGGTNTDSAVTASVGLEYGVIEQKHRSGSFPSQDVSSVEGICSPKTFTPIHGNALNKVSCNPPPIKPIVTIANKMATPDHLTQKSHLQKFVSDCPPRKTSLKPENCKELIHLLKSKSPPSYESAIRMLHRGVPPLPSPTSQKRSVTNSQENSAKASRSPSCQNNVKGVTPTKVVPVKFVVAGNCPELLSVGLAKGSPNIQPADSYVGAAPEGNKINHLSLSTSQSSENEPVPPPPPPPPLPSVSVSKVSVSPAYPFSYKLSLLRDRSMVSTTTTTATSTCQPSLQRHLSVTSAVTAAEPSTVSQLKHPVSRSQSVPLQNTQVSKKRGSVVAVKPKLVQNFDLPNINYMGNAPNVDLSRVLREKLQSSGHSTSSGAGGYSAKRNLTEMLEAGSGSTDEHNLKLTFDDFFDSRNLAIGSLHFEHSKMEASPQADNSSASSSFEDQKSVGRPTSYSPHSLQ